jgi:hypothetical protein
MLPWTDGTIFHRLLLFLNILRIFSLFLCPDIFTASPVGFVVSVLGSVSSWMRSWLGDGYEVEGAIESR